MTEEHENQGAEQRTEAKQKKDVLTISKLTVWKTLAGILGLLLIISIYTNGFKFGSELPGNSGIIDAQPAQPRAGNAPSPQAGAGTQARAVDMSALIDDDAVKGNANAPVTIVEWSDYECPFCARFYEQTLGQIDEQYIKTGKVKFIYRDFPLNFHANAQKAAEAAECAGEQGKYYEMHNKLFEGGVSGGVSSFKQYASDLGLDAAKFNDCIDSGKMANEIKKDVADGSAVGITGTPGFIINGQLVSGAQPFSAFQQVIEAEFAK